MRKILSLLVIGITLVINSFAQADVESVFPEEPQYKHGLGLGAGFTTGMGLTYRYTPNKFGFQASLLPFKGDEAELYSVGLTFMYYLVHREVTSLFLYQGNHYFYAAQDETEYDDSFDESVINNGFGFGVDFTEIDNINLSVMLGFMSYKTFKNIYPTAEVALMYTF